MISPFLMSFGVTRRLLEGVKIRTYIYVTLFFLLIASTRGIATQRSGFNLFGYFVDGNVLLRGTTLFFLWVILPVFVTTALAVHRKSFGFVCKISGAHPSDRGVLSGHIVSIIVYFATPILFFISGLWVVAAFTSRSTEPLLLWLPLFCIAMMGCIFTFCVFLYQMGWSSRRCLGAISITTVLVIGLKIFSLFAQRPEVANGVISSAVVSTFNGLRWLVPDLLRVSDAAIALPDASFVQWATVLNTTILAFVYFLLARQMIRSRTVARA